MNDHVASAFVTIGIAVITFALAIKYNVPLLNWALDSLLAGGLIISVASLAYLILRSGSDNEAGETDNTTMNRQQLMMKTIFYSLVFSAVVFGMTIWYATTDGANVPGAFLMAGIIVTIALIAPSAFVHELTKNENDQQ